MSDVVRIGTLLYGYCGGYFGRDSYEDKRVEAVGADWVVARELHGTRAVVFTTVPLELLAEHTEPEEEPT